MESIEGSLTMMAATRVSAMQAVTYQKRWIQTRLAWVVEAVAAVETPSSLMIASRFRILWVFSDIGGLPVGFLG